MREIRRQDRIMDDTRAEALLSSGEYGFLAMANIDGGGYGIPINYVCDGDSVYFHCAPDGHKLDNIAANDKVTFTVVGSTKVNSRDFTTAYESVMLFGRITSEVPADERLHALRLLVCKYSPDYIDKGETYIAKSFHRTGIMKLTIERVTAKAKLQH